jgi:GTP 3',8-cyclase
VSTAASDAGLVDSHGRPITYLRISIVDRCNLRCFYCMPGEGIPKRSRGEILRLEEIVEVARAAAALGIAKIRITGGEPLIRRGVVKITRDIAAIPGVRTVTMTTNGTRLAKYAEVLKDAGLDRVNVSLDSLDPERYRRITRGGCLEDALSGIDAALAAGLPVKVNAVLFEDLNLDELDAFAALARERDIEVRFIERMSFVLNKPFVSEDEAVAQLSRRHRMLPLEEANRGAHVNRYDCDGARIGFISPRSRPFCAACDKLRLTPAGELRACLASKVSVDIRPVLRRRHTEEELQASIREAARLKPARGPWTTPLEMWNIGG